MPAETLPLPLAHQEVLVAFTDFSLFFLSEELFQAFLTVSGDNRTATSQLFMCYDFLCVHRNKTLLPCPQTTLHSWEDLAPAGIRSSRAFWVQNQGLWGKFQHPVSAQACLVSPPRVLAPLIPMSRLLSKCWIIYEGSCQLKFGSLLPPCGVWDWTQVIRLWCSWLYPLNHLATPIGIYS